MFKFILRLLTASTSLVALLFVTNSLPAIAATPNANSVQLLGTPIVSLNISSLALQSSDNGNYLLQHLGCTCPACTQTLEQSEAQI
ncbi:MAG: hypothetical protein AAFQ41_08220 [Cyanobacteria bacterium J06623_7]